jgi:excisionase family DNA binding protein
MARKKQPSDLITPTQAGKLLGLGSGAKAIYSAIKRGRLAYHKFGEKTYLLERAAVEEYGRIAKPGRPWPKKKPSRPKK